jgi:regulatory protein
MTKSIYLEKIKYYCKYQERCHLQVRLKLVELGARGLDLENIMAELIHDDLLNEQRFAIQYTTGKFNQLGWGKIKIKQGLKQNQISEFCINKALATINLNDYFAKCNKYANKKWLTLTKERNSMAKQTKLKNFLLQKGYELNLILEISKEITQQ